MRRLSSRATDLLTTVHKLVGVVWAVAAIAALVLVVPGASTGAADWDRVALFGRIGSSASVVTLVLGFAYMLLTVWGFLGSRWLMAKWALYLIAVASSGYAIRATREHDSTLAIALAAVQLVAIATSIGVGVYLERSRHAGKLPRSSAVDHEEGR